MAGGTLTAAQRPQPSPPPGIFHAILTRSPTTPTLHPRSLFAYGPLAGGTLSGKYHDPANPPSDRARHMLFPNFQQRYHSERTRAAAAEYIALAKRKGITPTQVGRGDTVWPF